MIYGYALREVNEFGLIELRELTFSASPTVLRDIAAFLTEAANLMESGHFRNCSHRHIESAIPGWDITFPEKDIVVTPPTGDEKWGRAVADSPRVR